MEAWEQRFVSQAAPAAAAAVVVARLIPGLERLVAVAVAVLTPCPSVDVRTRWHGRLSLGCDSSIHTRCSASGSP